MRVSVKWLSEYLDLSGIKPVDLADQITLTGIEVDDVSLPAVTLEKVVVGEVLTAEKMPDSDHLKATMVEVGEEEPGKHRLWCTKCKSRTKGYRSLTRRQTSERSKN